MNTRREHELKDSKSRAEQKTGSRTSTELRVVAINRSPAPDTEDRCAASYAEGTASNGGRPATVDQKQATLGSGWSRGHCPRVSSTRQTPSGHCRNDRNPGRTDAGHTPEPSRSLAGSSVRRLWPKWSVPDRPGTGASSHHPVSVEASSFPVARQPTM